MKGVAPHRNYDKKHSKRLREIRFFLFKKTRSLPLSEILAITGMSANNYGNGGKRKTTIKV